MRPMTNRKRPQVYITRKLPDAVETRMRELFDAEHPQSEALCDAVLAAEAAGQTTLLLADDALTESLLDPQGEQDAELRDQTSELTRLVNSLPAADIADALESLPPDERQVLWQQVDPERHGQILVEGTPEFVRADERVRSAYLGEAA